MQLNPIKYLVKFIFIITFSTTVVAQTKNSPKAEIDILGGYYNQDGEHSAVEGGIGTQELQSVIGGINVKVTRDSSNSYSWNLGVDGYSSASTDQIDKTAASQSSASASDTRKHISVTYTRTTKNKHKISPTFSFSKEWDVTSLSGKLQWTKSINNDNSTFSLSAEYYNDKWLLIYPTEIGRRPEYEPQGENRYDSDYRHTFVTSFSYSQV